MSPKSNNVESGNALAEPITLFHRRQQNCQLRVEIEQSAAVEVKADIEDLIRKTETTPEPKDLELPCEIVGIDAAEVVSDKKSKKAKSKKSVKLRFHPTVLRCARSNERLRAAVRGTAKRLIDQFFGQDWSIEPPTAEDPTLALAEALRKLLTTRKGLLRISPESTTITWPLVETHVAASKKSVASLLASAKKSLRVHVSCAADQDGVHKDHETSIQRATITVERHGKKADVVEVRFIRGPQLADSDNCDHVITVNHDLGYIRMRVFHDANTTTGDSNGVVHVDGNKGQMIQSTQLSVDSLRKSLSDSLNLDTSSGEDTSYSGVPLNSPVRKTSSERRPLNTLHQTDDGVVIQIARSRFTVSPAPNAEPAATVESHPRALHVVIADKSAKENVHSDSSASVVTDIPPGSYSPTDSADSGIVSWGDLSPSPTTAPTAGHPLKEDRARLRPRSNSVNFINENGYNSGSTTSINGLPLKGILKKSRGSFSSTGSSASGVGLRRNTRFVLARSVSECHDEISAAEAFHGVVLNSLSIAEAFGEDEEDRLLPACNGSLTSVSEEGELDSDGAVEPQQRKKRVSFNEHVQARVYRSNSSILGQKKKNERKSRSKRKRSDSEGDHSDGVESDLNSKVDEEKSRLAQKTAGADNASGVPNNEEKPAVLERHDSGIDEEPPTPVRKSVSKVAAVNGVWRTRSTDSAVVDDQGPEIDTTSL